MSEIRQPVACHWIRGDDGFTVLIPGCWGRVHDPDAPCTCGEWSEDHAREVINGLRAHVTRARYDLQRLRQAMRQAGVPDPTMPTAYEDWKTQTARQRRRQMHKAISGGKQ